MTCEEARERILESLDATAAAHCGDCAAFFRMQCALDQALAMRFGSVEMPRHREAAIRRVVQDRRRAVWKEAAIDSLHGAGWLASAGIAMLVFPSAPFTLLLAVALTGFAAQWALRGWMEEG